MAYQVLRSFKCVPCIFYFLLPYIILYFMILFSFVDYYILLMTLYFKNLELFFLHNLYCRFKRILEIV